MPATLSPLAAARTDLATALDTRTRLAARLLDVEAVAATVEARAAAAVAAGTDDDDAHIAATMARSRVTATTAALADAEKAVADAQNAVTLAEAADRRTRAAAHFAECQEAAAALTDAVHLFAAAFKKTQAAYNAGRDANPAPFGNPKLLLEWQCRRELHRLGIDIAVGHPGQPLNMPFFHGLERAVAERIAA